MFSWFIETKLFINGLTEIIFTSFINGFHKVDDHKNNIEYSKRTCIRMRSMIVEFQGSALW
jgi:hypothetical protein